MVIAIAAILAVSAILPAAAQAAYDRDVVVQVMRSNVQTLGQVRAALAKGDFYAAAEGFWKFAEGQNRIMQFTPPRAARRSGTVCWGNSWIPPFGVSAQRARGTPPRASRSSKNSRR
ncbi:MAG: hypothetical protein M0C28_30315 [Candidatus Moduliflexus flocculans]|nr:hypothetical protein [Candidatus Moduliflexus flocculans]